MTDQIDMFTAAPDPACALIAGPPAGDVDPDWPFWRCVACGYSPASARAVGEAGQWADMDRHEAKCPAGFTDGRSWEDARRRKEGKG